jgi:1-acyl-sn-glycerol-3-phosphate acyltransferase
MLRFWFVLIVSIPVIFVYIARDYHIEKHSGRYTEEQRYRWATLMIKIIQKNGRIRTDVIGLENLPQDGGYVMYANHQGKYDALGIMSVHHKPCTVVMDEKRSHMPIANSFINLIQGGRLDKNSIKNQLEVIKKVINEVELGRKYIIFPEGGYFHNRNDVKEFMPGTFKCSIRSKTPIVPVALIDSYKPFELNSLRPVRTKVVFLKPLYYEEYKNMNSKDIAIFVRNQIVNAIQNYA